MYDYLSEVWDFRTKSLCKFIEEKQKTHWGDSYDCVNKNAVKDSLRPLIRKSLLLQYRSNFNKM